MLNINGILIGINIIGRRLKDLSLGIYTINLEVETALKYKSFHLGFLLGEIQILIPKDDN